MDCNWTENSFELYIGGNWIDIKFLQYLIHFAAAFAMCFDVVCI